MRRQYLAVGIVRSRVGRDSASRDRAAGLNLLLCAHPTRYIGRDLKVAGGHVAVNASRPKDSTQVVTLG